MISIDSVNIYFFLTAALKIIQNWWWVPLPFILWKPFLFLYLWWRVDNFINHQQMVLLEIKLPKEIQKPIRAMEVVLSSIHAAVYQPPDLWEKWVDGQVQMSVALEMASINGEPHFYIRTPKQYRDAVESSLYSQYPEVEIKEMDDYTKYVPQSIPNKEWDLFGSDYRMIKDDHYPIKTYLQFETEREATEEQKIDPIAALLEGMAKIKEGEQLWFQFLIEPIGDADLELSYSKWKKAGEALRDKLARRPITVKEEKPIIQEAAEILITGKVPEQKEEVKEIIPPEMKLTPGEREILAAIEQKMSKPIFRTTVRFIYMGRRDVWFKPNFRLAFAFYNEYTTNNLNAIFPNGKTLTKIKKALIFQPLNASFIRSRRHYLRCRKLLRNYIRRLTPYFPRSGGTFMMTTEELASLYHFPGQGAAPAPGVPRIEAKRGGVPPELPVE